MPKPVFAARGRLSTGFFTEAPGYLFCGFQQGQEYFVARHLGCVAYHNGTQGPGAEYGLITTQEAREVFEYLSKDPLPEPDATRILELLQQDGILPRPEEEHHQ